MENKKKLYDIKVNRGDGFRWEGAEYLNVFDTDEQKDIEIERIRKEYHIKPDEYLNISNFSNVYY